MNSIAHNTLYSSIPTAGNYPITATPVTHDDHYIC